MARSYFSRRVEEEREVRLRSRAAEEASAAGKTRASAMCMSSDVCLCAASSVLDNESMVRSVPLCCVPRALAFRCPDKRGARSTFGCDWRLRPSAACPSSCATRRVRRSLAVLALCLTCLLQDGLCFTCREKLAVPAPSSLSLFTAPQAFFCHYTGPCARARCRPASAQSCASQADCTARRV